MQHKDDSNRRDPNDDSWKRPLSDAPVQEFRADSGAIIRVDRQNRVLCHAKRKDGQLCKAPVVTGMKVCKMHGGSTQAAKRGAALRLAELVNPAIATLAREMTNADKSADKQRAANSILDRAGHGRHQIIEASDSREILRQGLLDLWNEGQKEGVETEEPDAPSISEK